MGMDCEEMCSRGVDTSDNEIGTNVTLILEEVLLEQGHASDDSGLAACG